MTHQQEVGFAILGMLILIACGLAWLLHEWEEKRYRVREEKRRQQMIMDIVRGKRK